MRQIPPFACFIENKGKRATDIKTEIKPKANRKN